MCIRDRPYQCNVQGIFYNKELFDKVGVAYPTGETTYEDMLGMLAKFKENGITPLSICLLYTSL